MRQSLFIMIALFCTSSLALAGQGPPKYRVLAQDKGHVAIVSPTGQVEWETPCNYMAHELTLLPNGNFLINTGPATLVEMTPQKKVVWSWEGKPVAPYTGKVEIHGAQRLENGLTMIAETGNRRIIEVDGAGKIVHQIPLTVDHLSPHSDTRMARKLDNGHYLVCHETDGVVREYDDGGKVVWSYALDLDGRPRSAGHGPEGHGNQVFGAIRLPNGNTLIAAGNGNRIIEVNPGGKVVWSIEHNELPGITLAWTTTLELLPNGNLIFGNCHAGPNNPQLIGVTRDKKVVWTFRDFDHFGNSVACAQVLGIEGKVIR
jgi:hypothetical protein